MTSPTSVLRRTPRTGRSEDHPTPRTRTPSTKPVRRTRPKGKRAPPAVARAGRAVVASDTEQSARGSTQGDPGAARHPPSRGSGAAGNLAGTEHRPRGRRGPPGKPLLTEQMATLVHLAMAWRGASLDEIASVLKVTRDHTARVLSRKRGLASDALDRLRAHTASSLMSPIPESPMVTKVQWGMSVGQAVTGFPDQGSTIPNQLAGLPAWASVGPEQGMFLKQWVQLAASERDAADPSGKGECRVHVGLDKLILRSVDTQTPLSISGLLPSSTREQQCENWRRYNSHKRQAFSLHYAANGELEGHEGVIQPILVRTAGPEALRRMPPHLRFRRHILVKAADSGRQLALLSAGPFSRRCERHRKVRTHVVAARSPCSPDSKCPRTHYVYEAPPGTPPGTSCSVCETLMRSARKSRLELNGLSWETGTALSILQWFLGAHLQRDGVVVDEVHVAVDIDVPMYDILPFGGSITKTRSFQNPQGVPDGRRLGLGPGVALAVYDLHARVRAQVDDGLDSQPPLHVQAWKHATRFEFRVRPNELGISPLLEGLLPRLADAISVVKFVDRRAADRDDPLWPLMLQAQVFGLTRIPRHAVTIRRRIAKLSEEYLEWVTCSGRWTTGQDALNAVKGDPRLKHLLKWVDGSTDWLTVTLMRLVRSGYADSVDASALLDLIRALEARLAELAGKMPCDPAAHALRALERLQKALDGCWDAPTRAVTFHPNARLVDPLEATRPCPPPTWGTPLTTPSAQVSLGFLQSAPDAS
jgi:hypothetical protein